MDLETGAVLGVTVQDAHAGDTTRVDASVSRGRGAASTSRRIRGHEKPFGLAGVLGGRGSRHVDYCVLRVRKRSICSCTARAWLQSRHTMSVTSGLSGSRRCCSLFGCTKSMLPRPSTSVFSRDR